MTITIGNRVIGEGCPVFIIAEAGVNHNGDITLAKKMVDGAVSAGADAIKFQSFVTEETISLKAPKAPHQLAHSDKNESQFAMIKKLELSEGEHRELIAYARSKGIIFLSTPYDLFAVDWLDKYGVSAYKIASMDVDTVPFLKYVASKKKPILLSTGMSFLEEVKAGVEAIRGVGNPDIVLLHCTSNYPAKKTNSNLKAMQTLARQFNTLVGYSDHTEGSEIALYAVCLGACVIEKHFTIDKNLPGPDHALSMEPEEFKDLVNKVRSLEIVLGDGKKAPVGDELPTRKALKRSIFTKNSIRKGKLISWEDIALKRPGTGIPVSQLNEVLSKNAVVDIEAGQMLTWEMIR